MPDNEWELAWDRHLDDLTDEQLRYAFKSLLVTLDERLLWFVLPPGAFPTPRVVTSGSIWGPFTYDEACTKAREGRPPTAASRPPHLGGSDGDQ